MSRKSILPIRITLRRVVLTVLTLLVLLVAGGWFVSSHYSFEPRFARSKPAFEAYAARVMASDPASPMPAPPLHLGAFETSGAERLPHGFLFFCNYGHPLDANGIAYSTQPLPADIGEHDFFKHIEGNWYAICRN
jgi:hypothetical protein